MQVTIWGLDKLVDNIDSIVRSQPNVISIRDNNATALNQKLYNVIDNAGLQNLLAVEFDDLLEPLSDNYGRDEKPPEEQDIIKIINWAKQKMAENGKDFIVQCTAGISRSSAVAILVNYLQDPQNALKVINPLLHSPNARVLELGEKILNAKDLKEQTGKLLKEHDAQFLDRMDNPFNYQKQK